MRIGLATLAALAASWAAAPAWSQWSPAGPLTFQQGKTYELQFSQPALPDFLAGDVYVQYSPLVFEPIALLPGSLTGMLSIMPSAPAALASGMHEVYIQIIPSNTPPPGDFGLNLPAGSMFGVKFKVKGDAPLGIEETTTDFTFTFGDPTHLNKTLEIPKPGEIVITSNITAVPEPATWATLLAGLGVLAACALRARRSA